MLRKLPQGRKMDSYNNAKVIQVHQKMSAARYQARRTARSAFNNTMVLINIILGKFCEELMPLALKLAQKCDLDPKRGVPLQINHFGTSFGDARIRPTTV